MISEIIIDAGATAPALMAKGMRKIIPMPFAIIEI
jgi:hypothetical protein